MKRIILILGILAAATSLASAQRGLARSTVRPGTPAGVVPTAPVAVHPMPPIGAGRRPGYGRPGGIRVVPEIEGDFGLGTEPDASLPSSARISGETATPGPDPAPFVGGTKILSTNIEELTRVRGMQENEIIGAGIVVGLAGTGDGSNATRQALASFLIQLGINRSMGEVSAGNIALVAIRAKLPAFAQVGQQVDVEVVSVGDAKSLFGGVLIAAPMFAGRDSEPYAHAAGPLSVSGIASDGSNARVMRNHPTAGEIPDGATICRSVQSSFVSTDGNIRLDLNRQSFQDATAIQDAINSVFPTPPGLDPVAIALTPATVLVRVPSDLSAPHHQVKFLSIVQKLSVEPEASSVVVVDKKSGTIVIGQDVRISAAAIQIGGFNLTIADTPTTSQPAPFSERGRTQVTETTDINLDYDPRRRIEMIDSTTTLSDVVRALNSLNVRSHDLIEVLTALKRAGSLHAKLEIK